MPLTKIKKYLRESALEISKNKKQYRGLRSLLDRHSAQYRSRWAGHPSFASVWRTEVSDRIAREVPEFAEWLRLRKEFYAVLPFHHNVGTSHRYWLCAYAVLRMERRPRAQGMDRMSIYSTFVEPRTHTPLDPNRLLKFIERLERHIQEGTDVGT